MHGISVIFGELALIAALGVLVSVILRRIKLPPVAGLLLVGALCGPHAFGVVADQHRLELLAEVGVVLLLFTIGLEFSLARLKAIAKLVLLGGTLQVALTSGAVFLWFSLQGVASSKAVLIGFVFALSSTAIVLRALAERQETSAPHGRFIVGVLIFQDLIVVAMLLVIPALGATGDGDISQELLWALGKSCAVVVGALGASKYLMPRALAWVEATRSREVFVLAVVALCLGTAWLTSHLGLSLALGAFLAGVIIADSDYAHRALEDVIPLRDVLTSLFFVSMGMLFNVHSLLEFPVEVFWLFAAFVLGKGLIASLAALVMRFPARVAWLAGASLAQFGEFGFVLASEGERAGIISREELEPILAAGLLSMFITRIVMSLAPRLAAGEVLLRPLERLLRVRGIDEIVTDDQQLSGHVVIVGFGPGGRVMAQRLHERAKPYIVLELNAQTVREEREAGVPIYYGDITSREARRHAAVSDAAVVVLQISDEDAASRAVSAIRADGNRVPIYVRAHRLSDSVALKQLGATHVVSEEDAASAQLSEDVQALLLKA